MQFRSVIKSLNVPVGSQVVLRSSIRLQIVWVFPFGHSIIPFSHIRLFPYPCGQNGLCNSIESQINSIESQILPWLPAHVIILEFSTHIPECMVQATVQLAVQFAQHVYVQL